MTFRKNFLHCCFVSLLSAGLSVCASSAQAADRHDLVLYDTKPLPSWHVTLAGQGWPERELANDAVTVLRPADGQKTDSAVDARRSKVTEGKDERDALTLHWKDVWYAGLRLGGGAPLDLRPYIAGGTLEFDLNVIELDKGGIYVTMRCGDDCNRKVPYVRPARALQGKGWQHLSFSMACFARKEDDFSKVPVPFSLEGTGTGEVAVANVRLVRQGKPNADCPDYRTAAVTSATPVHSWSFDWWMPRHEKKLEEIRKLKEAGKNPQVVFIGDSITQGWEQSGLPVWKRYYEKYDAVDLGFGGDLTQNVLWRLEHGEVDGLDPKVAVLMIGTNNTGDRQDDPKATAAGVKRIIAELRQRLPHTKILLLAIFPRDEKPTNFQRRLNERVNGLISDFADGRNVFFLDINATLTNPDGTLSKDIMPDLLHPNEKGYEIWASSMEPVLQKLLSE
jgi:lysophospholipase L1-like esterase